MKCLFSLHKVDKQDEKNEKDMTERMRGGRPMGKAARNRAIARGENLHAGNRQESPAQACSSLGLPPGSSVFLTHLFLPRLSTKSRGVS